MPGARRGNDRFNPLEVPARIAEPPLRISTRGEPLSIFVRPFDDEHSPDALHADQPRLLHVFGPNSRHGAVMTARRDGNLLRQVDAFFVRALHLQPGTSSPFIGAPFGQGCVRRMPPAGKRRSGLKVTVLHRQGDQCAHALRETSTALRQVFIRELGHLQAKTERSIQRLLPIAAQAGDQSKVFLGRAAVLKEPDALARFRLETAFELRSLENHCIGESASGKLLSVYFVLLPIDGAVDSP